MSDARYLLFPQPSSIPGSQVLVFESNPLAVDGSPLTLTVTGLLATDAILSVTNKDRGTLGHEGSVGAFDSQADNSLQIYAAGASFFTGQTFLVAVKR